MGHGQAIGHAGLYIEIALLIHAFDLRQFRHGLACDEIGQRHQPIAGAHLERIKGGQHAVFFGQAHADINFLV